MPSNLPALTTSFIGREREAADLKRGLSSTRLLTITGAGGCGKSRLACEAAAEVLDTFPDGVWWVDLASITDSAIVAKTVASTAGVQEIANEQILETLGDNLHHRQVLILLDNCEHVIEACAHLAQSVLASTISTSFLATSREPLGVSGEVTFRIPSLSFPSDPPPGTIEALSQYDAVRLFIDRVTQARPEFRATNETAPAIAEICRRLDGIPLAIELAAARMRDLALDEIASGLVDAFRLLTGGERTGLPRQRTIEASIDWSHELLLPAERTFFRRLGVFAGGFTLEAAERVCSGDGLEEREILDLLTGLVDKSLVQMDSEPRAARYRFLETIRQYAGWMLAASGEADAARTRHLDYMVAFAERAALELESPGHQRVIEMIVPDMDNIRGALDWSLEQGDGSAGLRIAAALWLYWGARAVSEGQARLRAALGRTSSDRRARGAALAAAAELSLALGDPMSSLGFADEGVSISRETGDEKTLARSMLYAGLTRNFVDPGNARPLLEESVELGRKTGDAYSLGLSLGGLGFLELMNGFPARARACFEESTIAANEAGNPVLAARSSFSLGWALLELTELPAARNALKASIATAAAVGTRFWDADSHPGLAMVDLLEGSIDRARVQLVRAVAEAGEGLSGFELAIALWCAGQAACAAGEADHAAAILSQGIPIQAAAGLRWLEAWSLALLAELEVKRGDGASARARIDEAAGVVREAPNGIAEGRLNLARATAAVAVDDLEPAEDDVHHALRLFAESEHRQGVVDALERLAWLLARLEIHDAAARLLGAAGSARSMIGYVRFPADVGAFNETQRRCRAAMGEEALDAAVDEGAALSLDQAVAYASRGRGARKRPSTGWASLTPAEVDVVGLAAQGLTNAAIARRLFISPRTVQAHLARVFAKLGVVSRTELAAEAIKRGLPPS